MALRFPLPIDDTSVVESKEALVDISVIIVSYNTGDILIPCLQSLYKSKGDFSMEVLVIDNASSDNSLSLVEENFPQVRLFANSENLGFAAACNQGYQHSTGRYLLLLNSDAFVSEEALQNALLFMDSHPDCGLCAGKQVTPEGQLKPSARQFPSVLSKLLIMSGLQDRYPSSPFFGQADYRYFDHESPLLVDWAPGAFNLIRRQMLDEIGFFDERYYMYFEEVDLCLRAQKAGWKSFFIPDAVVSHIGGASAQKRKDREFREASADLILFRTRSEQLYFRKNHGLFKTLLNTGLEILWYSAVYFYNLRNFSSRCKKKRSEAKHIIQHSLKALRDTRCGSTPPPTPW